MRYSYNGQFYKVYKENGECVACFKNYLGVVMFLQAVAEYNSIKGAIK